ncbi:MAG: hypothetical protein GF383_04600 [Candidatus Lokiarchaeota archaeon]|nr:hypothetical protein [Candidatus Lokiarchaeota archaeon]MBD3339065.1 hypothetical protein [Candidatus Lokiarchaeota archaeon]
MEEIENVYKIDKKRLLNYFMRVKKSFQHLDQYHLIAKFLNNQSIGTDSANILEIINFYKNKLLDRLNALDFAFEWIRAQKIRLEYKKYLIRAQYPNNNLSLAVDDCIVKFFLKYDDYIRRIFKENIYEHEISTLYEIFFSPYEKEHFNLKEMLKWHKNKVITIIKGNLKIITNLMTLRSGLSRIIVKDYEGVLYSRKDSTKEEKKSTTQQIIAKGEKTIIKDVSDFNGSHLERILKTYCFNKREIGTIEIENAINQFLTSYFKFGKFYSYDEFKEKLIQSLIDYINSGLTEKVKTQHSMSNLGGKIFRMLNDFRKINRIKVLDGLAWVNELKPVLKKFLVQLLDNMFNPKLEKPETKKIDDLQKEENDTEKLDDVNFSAIFDLNLEVEKYREKLEALLQNSDKSIVEKRNIIRTKVQKFKMEKRKSI